MQTKFRGRISVLPPRNVGRSMDFQSDHELGALSEKWTHQGR